jgi:uncharacterized Fe-S cluster protein YjdI
MEQYRYASIAVSFDPDKCTHCGDCVAGLPAVFAPDRHPWIDPSGADSEQIKGQVARCPSGALSFQG